MKFAQKITKNEKILYALEQLMFEANKTVLVVYESSDSRMEVKNDATPVTKADLDAHDIISVGLTTITPAIPVVSEENPESHSIPLNHSIYWLMDPLDGTKEFLSKNAQFTCNVALIENKRASLGLVSVPVENCVYRGGYGLGSVRIDAFKHRVSIRVASQIEPLRVVVSKSHSNQATKRYVAALQRDVEIIEAGSSLKFLHIAEGAADLYPRLATTCEWDTAAGQAILEGAGGSVNTLDGDRLSYGKPGLKNPHFIAKATNCSSINRRN